MNMKKWIQFLAAGVIVLLLAACSNDVIGGKNLEDIFKESIAAMEDLESYSMEMNMEQELSSPTEEAMTIKMSSVSDVQQHPLLLHQTIRMEMDDEEIVYESYFSEEDGFFMEEPMLGGWMKLPDEFVADLVDIDSQISPQDQLKSLQAFITDLSLTTDDKSYIISVKGEDVDMEAIFQQINGLFGEDMLEADDFMPDMEIDGLEYEIVIDKETMYQTEAKISMNILMNFMGEEITTKQNLHLKISRFNEVGAFEIPEEVMNEAVEMDDEGIFGF